MQIVFGLTIALLTVTVALLALLRSGIRRQERATSLASEPCGLSAALARRVLGLYASQPIEIGNLEAASRPDQRIADGTEARRS